ncbi:MAG: DUF4176 domain-containing protein [Christensenella sp.]
MKKILCIILCIVLVTGLAACGTPAQSTIGDASGKVSEEDSAKMLENSFMLPIGSVISVKDNDGLIMIIGKLQYLGDDTNTLYDYSGVDYPAGLIDPKNNYVFNQNQIEQIYFVGYETSENEALNKKIEEIKTEKSVEAN